MPRRTPSRRPIALAVASAAALLASCRGPRSIESIVELETDRGVVHAVSTESGILALTDVLPAGGELSFRYRTGNGFFDDVAAVGRRTDALAVLVPKSSRLNLARFAAWPAAADDELYVEVRTADGPDLLPCKLVDGGRRGDLVAIEEGVLADVAQRCAGCGLFAWRDEAMELVGVLNGVYCESPAALAFIGLDEMSALLPAESSYFARRVTPRRADFEYGVPRDFEGERAHSADPPSAAPADEPPVEPPPAEPTAEPPTEPPPNDDEAPREDR